MNLNVFKENLKRKDITIKDEKCYIDVFCKGKLCAKIFMDKDFAYWMDTSVVPQPFRRQLSSYVTEADKYITEDKRKVLAKLFGKEIHYMEVIE